MAELLAFGMTAIVIAGLLAYQYLSDPMAACGNVALACT
jgi:hypothetical protein